MAAQHSAQVSVQRSGEGAAIGVDLAQVPLPEGHIETDHWWAFQRDGAISIVFDQVPTGGELKFRLEARMSYEAFMGLISTIEGENFKTAFQNYLETHPLLTGPGTPKPAPDTKATAHQIVRVGAIRMSHVGSEAEAVLFSLSANELSAAIRSGGVTAKVTALVRIGGTTRAMASLLSDCRKLAAEISPILTQVERQ